MPGPGLDRIKGDHYKAIPKCTQMPNIISYSKFTNANLTNHNLIINHQDIAQ